MQSLTLLHLDLDNLDFLLLCLMFLACPVNNVLGKDGRTKAVDKGVAVLSSKSGRRGENNQLEGKTSRNFPQISLPREMAHFQNAAFQEEQ